MELRALVLFLPLATVVSANQESLPEGKHNITCECIAATSGCSFQYLYEAAGSQRLSWVQERNEGGSVDLSQACYHERDEDKHGQGLCCEPLDGSEESIEQVFRGTLR